MKDRIAQVKAACALPDFASFTEFFQKNSRYMTISHLSW